MRQRPDAPINWPGRSKPPVLGPRAAPSILGEQRARTIDALGEITVVEALHPHPSAAVRCMHETAVADSDGHILLDADLAVLAAEPSRYDAYAQAIRREYAHIPAEAYRQGRTAVLARLLAREQLYFLSAHGAWETSARLNLRREMARLATMS